MTWFYVRRDAFLRLMGYAERLVCVACSWTGRNCVIGKRISTRTLCVCERNVQPKLTLPREVCYQVHVIQVDIARSPTVYTYEHSRVPWWSLRAAWAGWCCPATREASCRTAASACTLLRRACWSSGTPVCSITAMPCGQHMLLHTGVPAGACG